MINGRAGIIAWSVTSLMTKTEMVLKILIYSPVNHLMWLLGQENFIEFFPLSVIWKWRVTLQAHKKLYMCIDISWKLKIVKGSSFIFLNMVFCILQNVKF